MVVFAIASRTHWLAASRPLVMIRVFVLIRDMAASPTTVLPAPHGKTTTPWLREAMKASTEAV